MFKGMSAQGKWHVLNKLANTKPEDSSSLINPLIENEQKLYFVCQLIGQQLHGDASVHPDVSVPKDIVLDAAALLTIVVMKELHCHPMKERHLMRALSNLYYHDLKAGIYADPFAPMFARQVLAVATDQPGEYRSELAELVREKLKATQPELLLMPPSTEEGKAARTVINPLDIPGIVAGLGSDEQLGLVEYAIREAKVGRTPEYAVTWIISKCDESTKATAEKMWAEAQKDETMPVLPEAPRGPTV